MVSEHPPRRFLMVPVVVDLFLVSLIGCAQQDEITHYTVPRQSVPVADEKPKPPEQTAAKDRMLAAIIPQKAQTWFFKVTGPTDAVAKEADAFTALIKSVRFENAAGTKPKWTLPAAWREQPGSGMRYATMQFGSTDPPLELTVIPLPNAGGDVNEQVLSNVNRWRGQMQLPAIAQNDLATTATQLKLEGGATATLVNLEGKMGQAMQPMKFPGANGAGDGK